MKKILLVLTLLGVIGGSYGFYLYNKPSSDVVTKQVDIKIDAQKLVAAFKRDETVANSEYLNKVILVTGTVKSVSTEGETTNVLLASNDQMSSVSCEFAQPQKSIKTGDKLSIKGNCAGYLMDVVLTKCVTQN